MTLSFSTKWPDRMPDHLKNKPNLFIEKIHLGLLNKLSLLVFRKHFREYRKKFGKVWDGRYLTEERGYFTDNYIQKIHTIRQDSKDRWKPGTLIHFVINNRTANRFQFAPVIPCTSTQNIVIKRDSYGPSVWIDGKILSTGMVNKLAINDGFESEEDFFSYFNTDFEGKIIHWTDLKY